MQNQKMSDAMAMYRRHQAARGLVPNTVKASTQWYTKTQQVWGDIFVRSIKPIHIDRLFTESNWSPDTRNMYLSGIRGFFKWARHEGIMGKDFDPTFGWTNLKSVQKPKMRVPVEEFPDLLEACTHPRDRAAIAIGLCIMVRGSEVQTMRIGDLDMSDRTLAILRKKTKQVDVMPVDDVLREEMVRWLNWYRQDQGELRSDWFLIPSKNPMVMVHDPVTHFLKRSGVTPSVRPMKKVSAPHEIVQRVLKSQGLPTYREGFHTLRRSAARALADSLRAEGTDNTLMQVAAWLGHADVKTTQHYIGLHAEKEKRNASVKNKPLFPNMLKPKESGLRLIRNEGGEGNG